MTTARRAGWRPGPGSPAVHGSDPHHPARSHILARFTELETERATIGAQLTKLETSRQLAPDLDLLDQLPILPDLMEYLSPGQYRLVYDAFGIELLYRHDLNQVTIHAAITTSTPTALTALIRQCEPLPPALAAAISDLEQHPRRCERLRDHGSARPGRVQRTALGDGPGDVDLPTAAGVRAGISAL